MAEVIQGLRDRIRRLEAAGRRDAERVISTGCAELDAMLPAGGLGAGAIHEWLAPPGGGGAGLLSLLAARSACASGGALVVIDPDRSFYPPAAAAWGLNLDNMIVLRCARGSGLLWAVDQALRCPAVAAVWGPLEFPGERWQRRFQLAARDSGATGLFVRPARAAGQPGWAEVQWLVENPLEFASRGKISALRGSGFRGPAFPRADAGGAGDSGSFDRRIALRLLRAPGVAALARPVVVLQMDFTTGILRKVDHAHSCPAGRVPRRTSGAPAGSGHLAAVLAHPAAGRRQRRA